MQSSEIQPAPLLSLPRLEAPLPWTILHNINTTEMVCEIEKLRDDDETLSGFSVSDFAAAVLGILRVEKTQGINEGLKQLTGAGFRV